MRLRSSQEDENKINVIWRRTGYRIFTSSFKLFWFVKRFCCSLLLPLLFIIRTLIYFSVNRNFSRKRVICRGYRVDHPPPPLEFRKMFLHLPFKKFVFFPGVLTYAWRTPLEFQLLLPYLSHWYLQLSSLENPIRLITKVFITDTYTAVY